MPTKPLIATGTLKEGALEGRVAIVTGGGGGIGFEAARALAWLGARVVLAEIRDTGGAAALKINEEAGREAALFIKTDVGDEDSVRRMGDYVFKVWGQVDIVLNNATIAPLGAVEALPIEVWDASYRVNLRGPVLLARYFLPGMLKRGYGVFVGVTSEGLAYMGAYEALKAAQLHLARTLDAELEGKGVTAFTIGPGMVPTATALRGLEELARLHGIPLANLQAMTQEHLLSVEEAGAGFAAAIALASRFQGQEIGARQALIAADIHLASEGGSGQEHKLEESKAAEAGVICRSVLATLREQSQGWQQRSIFERQWMLRDFKKHAGMPVEQWLESLESLAKSLEEGLAAVGDKPLPLKKLTEYYGHMGDLARGYVKDKEKLAENLRVIEEWQKEVERLSNYLQS
jgi:NAD(P)-dependent dehydrogenase (short-subunit alcohol dehydrogenase family)